MNISYLEASILKKAGARIDVKVSYIVTPENDLKICIRDFVFLNFKTAAQFIRHIAETELIQTETEPKEMAA